MQLAYSHLKGTDIPFIKVGLRRVDDSKLAFLWVVSRNGALKQAICLTDFGANAIVKLELGDTVFMIRAAFVTQPLAISFYVEGQNVRTMRSGAIVGPEIAEWVPREMIPLRIQEAIAKWYTDKLVPGKYFVAPDSRWEKEEDGKAKLVYSSDENEKIEQPPPTTRDGIYGKKRRHV